MPLLADILKAELKNSGRAVVDHLCEHFPLSRTELFAIVNADALPTVAGAVTTPEPAPGATEAPTEGGG